MSGGELHDTACPDCGYDGPHGVLGYEGDAVIAECGDITCAAEFSVPPEAEDS